MPAKKHTLSIHPDDIDGSSGADSFIAQLADAGGEPTATLSSLDKLDGRGGRDRIVAALETIMVAPVMKNIELGRFTHPSTAETTLDLAKARQMTSLQFSQINSDLSITHAAGVSSVSFMGYSDHEALLSGLDAAKVAREQLNFTACNNLTVNIDPLGTKPLKVLDVTLSDSQVWLYGEVATATIRVHSDGVEANTLGLYPSGGLGNTHRLTVSGTADIDLAMMVSYDNLHTYDASKASGAVTVAIGGEELQTVKGSRGDDDMHLGALGGTQAHKTQVLLGDGDDVVHLNGAFLDGRKHAIFAGDGENTVLVYGAIKHSLGLFHQFERIYITDAAGSYDLKGSGVMDVRLFGTPDDITLDHVNSGSNITLAKDQTAPLEVNVTNAMASTDDQLYMSLIGPTTFGTFTEGLSAPGLSNLSVYGQNGLSIFMLDGVGSQSDPLQLMIGGSSEVDAAATKGSTNFISKITITNVVGANISGLEWSEQAFVDTGATIIGGAGNDVLAGGAGGDIISTGAGDNEIYGSGGVDAINLTLNSGLDVIIFDHESESSYGAGDMVAGFGSFDAIDIGGAVDSVTFMGNVTSLSGGLATLSESQTRAFYETATQALYVDVNHDGILDAAHDMEVTLVGVSSISGFNLVV
ncbi:MAG: hypothetical protein JWM58_3394 [Rhizobium sp.]|nr:hypothetical protein [Rhizobium sp.]